MRINLESKLLREIKISKAKLKRAVDQASTKKKINSASDNILDSSTISKLKFSIGSLRTINEENIVSAKFVLNTAADTADAVTEKLNQIYALAKQSLDETLSNEARDEIYTAYKQKLIEIDSIVNTSKFEGEPLLDGNYSTHVQVGTEAGQTQSIRLEDVRSSGLKIEGLSIGSLDNAQKNLDYISNAIKKVEAARSQIDTHLESLDFRKNTNDAQIKNLEETRSQLEDLSPEEGLTQLNDAQSDYEFKLSLLENLLASSLVQRLEGK